MQPAPLLNFIVRRKKVSMQRALIIKHYHQEIQTDYSDLAADELNWHFNDGWRLVSACPFGCSVSQGAAEYGAWFAAVLVVIEKP